MKYLYRSVIAGLCRENHGTKPSTCQTPVHRHIKCLIFFLNVSIKITIASKEYNEY